MLTGKQEKFCQNIIKGMSQSDAYRDAYDVKKGTKDKSVHEQASVLMSDLNISSRIEELKNAIAEEVKYTQADCFRQLQKAFNLGELKQDPQAMKACAEACAKLLGLNKEKGDVNVTINRMPSVMINGEKLQINIGEDVNDTSSADS